MYTNFRFLDGSNPYITINNKALFEMFCKYDTVQEMEKGFLVICKKDRNPVLSYESKKAIARNIAIEWQNNFCNFRYDFFDLSNWCDFFEEIGRKYGLLKEFRENGIL